MMIILVLTLLPPRVCGVSSQSSSIKNISQNNMNNEQHWKTTHSKDAYLVIDNVTEFTTSHELSTSFQSVIKFNGNFSQFNVTCSGAECNTTIILEDMDETFQRFLVIKKYLDPSIMSVIFVVGTVGNITLLVILVRYKEMRTSANACIFTMVLGDLLSVIVNVPLFYALLVSESWTAGALLCKLLWFFSDFAVGLSIFAVTMLSVQRYRGIVNMNVHFRNGFSKLKSMLVSAFNISLIWILSFCFALRTAVTADVSNEKCSSVANYYGFDVPRNLALLNLFVFCIFPLCVIAVFYSLTARHLVASAQFMPGEMSKNHTRLINVRKKGAKVVLGLTFVFFISYVPWYLWQVVFFWGNFASHPKTATYTYTILYYFFFGNMCFNPIAIYCLSSTFRNYFNQYIFRKCKCKVKPGNETLKYSVKSKMSTGTTNTDV